MKARTILGIDPAIACGWSVLRLPGGSVTHGGIWTLKASALEGGGMMYVRLEGWLNAVLDVGVDAVAIEDVRRHAGTTAAHIYGGVTATVTRCCDWKDVPYMGVGVGVWKKYGVGIGNASKEAVKRAALIRWPGSVTWSQDQVDAAFIALAGAHELGWL